MDADLFRLPEIREFDASAQTIGGNPDQLRFISEARLRDAELRLAESRARAHLTLSVGIRRLQDTDDTAFVAGVSVPLFAARQARPGIAEARALRASVDPAAAAERLRAETTLFELVQELRHSITEASTLRDRVSGELKTGVTPGSSQARQILRNAELKMIEITNSRSRSN